jgi:hypothetical protein
LLRCNDIIIYDNNIMSNSNANLGNTDRFEVDGSGSTINPSGTQPLNPVNKAYTDAADAILQSAINLTQSDVDGFPDQLKQLDTAEIQQLENIGSETISNTQWSYLGGMDQAMTTLSNVDFNSVKTGGVEMLTGAVGEDVVFQTTDAQNRFRINLQGDSRYFSDTNIRTFGQDESVLSGYDVDGDSLWNWFTNTPGLDSDSILQTRSKNGLYVPYEIKRNGETLIRNDTSNVFTLKTGENGLSLYDVDGDLSMTLYADSDGSGTESLLQVTNKAGTATTFDINRNGSLIQRNTAGTQIFKTDTATQRFDVIGTIDTTNLIAGADTEINANGLCVKTTGSNGNCLLQVTSGGGTVMRNNNNDVNCSVDDNGVNVIASRDFIIAGGPTLKGVDFALDVVETNLTITTGIATTNQTNISNNIVNISNNTSAIANKADGSVSGSYSRVGPTSGQTEGISISSGTVAPTSGVGKNILLRGGNILEFGCSGISNVCAGQWAVGAANVATDNVVLGYGHIFSASMSNSVVIGSDNTMTSGNQRCIVVGDSLVNVGNDNIIIGQNSDTNGSESINFGNNNSDTSGGSDNTLIGFSTTISAGSNNIVIGNQSSVANNGTNIGYGSSVNGLSCNLGSFNQIGLIGGNSQTITLGNSIISNVNDAFVIGNNITNTSPGIILKSAFETAASGSTAVFQSLGSGIVKIGSLVSSRRYKTDIKPIEEDFKTSDIYKLHAKSFVYKDKYNNNKEVGVIAEDYVDCGSRLLESLVIWGDDENVADYEPRNKDGQVVKSFKYNSLIVPVIAEMKKLKHENEKLKKQMNQLSTNLNIFMNSNI